MIHQINPHDDPRGIKGDTLSVILITRYTTSKNQRGNSHTSKKPKSKKTIS
jgi:hypothetical protein